MVSLTEKELKQFTLTSLRVMLSDAHAEHVNILTLVGIFYSKAEAVAKSERLLERIKIIESSLKKRITLC